MCKKILFVLRDFWIFVLLLEFGSVLFVQMPVNLKYLSFIFLFFRKPRLLHFLLELLYMSLFVVPEQVLVFCDKVKIFKLFFFKKGNNNFFFEVVCQIIFYKVSFAKGFLFCFEDLGIDDEMDKILKNTSDEIDQVRLFPNGKYEPITLEGKKHFWFCSPLESFSCELHSFEKYAQNMQTYIMEKEKNAKEMTVMSLQQKKLELRRSQQSN